MKVLSFLSWGGHSCATQAIRPQWRSEVTATGMAAERHLPLCSQEKKKERERSPPPTPLIVSLMALAMLQTLLSTSLQPRWSCAGSSTQSPLRGISVINAHSSCCHWDFSNSHILDQLIWKGQAQTQKRSLRFYWLYAQSKERARAKCFSSMWVLCAPAQPSPLLQVCFLSWQHMLFL